MPTNYFNDGLNIIRTTTAIKTYFGDVTPVLRFPPTIGDSVNSAQSPDLSAIPFVVFAPYKRGVAGYTLNNPAEILDKLPAPEFNIVLPLPSSALSTSYSVTYDNVELGDTGAVASGLKRAFESLFSNEAAKEKLKNVGIELGQFAYQFGMEGLQETFKNKETGAQFDVKSLARLALGVVDNPFTEYTFRNVQFRPHVFNFTFIPRSLKESKLIDNIAQYFKFFMLPAYKTVGDTTAASYIEFPYEWQITHSTQDTTFRLLPSVLESFEIDYGGGLDSPKFFYDGNTTRYPTKITMKMTFKEVILLTRDRIETPQLADDPNFKPDTAFDRNSKFKRYRF